jgi:integrase
VLLEGPVGACARWSWKGYAVHCSICEISGQLGTHSMRKTFARNVHERLGNDLAKTKKALGHKNISATMHYMSFMDEEIDRAILEQ